LQPLKTHPLAAVVALMIIMLLAACGGEDGSAQTTDNSAQTTDNSAQTTDNSAQTTDNSAQSGSDNTSSSENSAQEGVVALVNGVPIDDAEFQRELERRQRNTTASDANALAVQVLDALIEQEIIRQAAAALDISVTDEEARDEVEALRASISAEDWQNSLELNGFTEEEFVLAQQEALLTQRVRDAVLAPLNDPVRQVRARHIVVQTEDAANSILARLQSGEPFEALAAEASIDVTTRDQGGDLGWFTAEELMDRRLASVAFSLEPGQIAGPVATSIGYHIVQTLEVAERDIEAERLPLLAESVFGDWLTAQYAAADIQRFR